MLKLSTLAILLAAITTVSACAELKDAGRQIGETTKEVTTDIGHATRDTTRAIGHASRDAVNSVKKDLSED
ncbi:hypothetical protein L2755_04155 [Shewanella abyssi]|nr:hypothetical protein [Shewanella abyssi]